MRQLVILSGKGGTGKTSVAAAFAHLATEGDATLRTVLADADVDAANLELVLAPETFETHEFVGGQVAVIAPQACRSCGRCAEVCRFDAVVRPGDAMRSTAARLHPHTYAIDPIACEGCAACVHQCPDEAIRMEPSVVGRWMRSQTRYGPLVHAALRPGQDNSGKLVSLVKTEASRWAEQLKADALIVDGPPGIGCPVIASASGADLALIVTEPTAAGIHDMERVLATAAHFRVPALVCVNKADVHPAGTARIETFCRDRGIALAGPIPFDATVTRAMVAARPVTAFDPCSPSACAIATLWRRVVTELRTTAKEHARP